MAEKITIRCTVNGEAREARAWPMARLLDVLREELGLTGTKEGCGEGECGACSVILDGRLVNSCLVPAVQADGAEIRTIEGIAARGEGIAARGEGIAARGEGVASGQCLHAVQEAFLRCGGAQCGICTPGMVLASVALLEKNPAPSMDDVREGLAGNLCRCTGYVKIFESVLEACKHTSGPGAAPVAEGGR